MAVINLRDSVFSTSSQDEVTILNQEILDLSSIVEQLPITDLSDVTIASVQDGELLVYNGTSGEWENSSALFPDSTRMKAYDLPDWVQFGNYNLDDSVPLSVNADSIGGSIWRRRTSFDARNAFVTGLFIDNNSTNPADWNDIGPGYSLNFADQNSIYYVGNFQSYIQDVTTDVNGNLDTFKSEFRVSTYRKDSGSPNSVGHTAIKVRYDETIDLFSNQVNVSNDLDIAGKISNNKYTLPGFFANPNPAYNPQNIPGITSLCGEGFATFNIWKRESALQPGTTGYLGMYYDTYTSPTPDDWKGRGPYLSMPIADKRSIFNLGAFRVRISPEVDPTLDVDGNLDSYTGEFQVETYNKLSGNDTAQYHQTASFSSRGTIYRMDDRANGNEYRFDMYADSDDMYLYTDAPNGFRIQQDMILQNTSLRIDASQVDFTNLPTSDPLVAGRLWNDAGTMKISAG